MLGTVTGTGRPTLTDVAAAAGVSRALVSIIIRGAPGSSEATRARVLAVAAELGYRPDQRARSLRQRDPRLLGVLFGVQDAFHGDLVGALYPAADALDYEIVLSGVTAGRSPQRAVETLLDDRCAALILLGPTEGPAWLGGLAGRLPVVSVARRVRAAGVDTVRTADAQGVGAAVDHLVELGHRAIVHIDGGRVPGAADRRQGYRTAMKRHGLVEHTQLVSGGGSEDDGARAASAVLAGPRPTAIIAFNDACAVGVLDSLLKAGLGVPGDISVVGFDDSRLARARYVDLTTVAQPVGELATAAVARAVGRLAPGAYAERPAGPGFDDELAPTLVVRATTGPAADPRS